MRAPPPRAPPGCCGRHTPPAGPAAPPERRPSSTKLDSAAAARNVEFQLQEGDVFLMGGATQKYYVHEVPRESTPCAARWSWTFRHHVPLRGRTSSPLEATVAPRTASEPTGPPKHNLLEASVGKSYLVVGYRFAPSKERVPVPWTHVAYVPAGFDRPQPVGRKRTRRVSPYVFAGNVGDFLIGLN